MQMFMNACVHVCVHVCEDRLTCAFMVVRMCVVCEQVFLYTCYSNTQEKVQIKRDNNYSCIHLLCSVL